MIVSPWDKNVLHGSDISKHFDINGLINVFVIKCVYGNNLKALAMIDNTLFILS